MMLLIGRFSIIVQPEILSYRIAISEEYLDRRPFSKALIVSEP